MPAIDRIAAILREHTIPCTTGDDTISVSAADEHGYEVFLRVLPGGGYAVYLATWHEEFLDEATAIETFLGGLTNAVRLKVVRRGNTDYRWTIQYRGGSGWTNGSTVGLLWFPFLRRKKTRYLQNDLLTSPNS